MYKFDREAYDRRMEWYRDARFGMFIHWGLYAIPARGEWVRSIEQIPKEDYMKYFEEFNPVDFDPRKWAKAAKEAGMKYMVLTAKHHDGFCLFDSQYTDFKSTNTKCGRDLVAEYVDAVRAEGLKVGLYFSLLDWFHDDFPHYGDRNHPMRNNPAYKNDDRDFDRYLTYMHNQVREICTNYGKLDVLWFDFSYDTLRGEAWKATELINMVRKLQPGCHHRQPSRGERRGLRFSGGRKSDLVPRRLCEPGADDSAEWHPGCKWKRYRLGILCYDEQSLGLLCQRPLLQTGTDADQKAGRVRIEGWKPAFERRPGRQGKYPGGVDRTAG